LLYKIEKFRAVGMLSVEILNSDYFRNRTSDLQQSVADVQCRCLQAMLAAVAGGWSLI